MLYANIYPFAADITHKAMALVDNLARTAFSLRCMPCPWWSVYVAIKDNVSRTAFAGHGLYDPPLCPLRRPHFLVVFLDRQHGDFLAQTGEDIDDFLVSVHYCSYLLCLVLVDNMIITLMVLQWWAEARTLCKFAQMIDLYKWEKVCWSTWNDTMKKVLEKLIKSVLVYAIYNTFFMRNQHGF